MVETLEELCGSKSYKKPTADEVDFSAVECLEKSLSSVRITNETPPRFSAIDLAMVVCQKDRKRAAEAIASLQKEGLCVFGHWKFPGERQRDTSVVTAKQAKQLFMALPGSVAKKNRLAIQKFLDGDLQEETSCGAKRDALQIEFVDSETSAPVSPNDSENNRPEKRQKSDTYSKEGMVSDILKEMVRKGSIPPFTRNRKIASGQIRPDFRWCTENAMVVLECDENQHKNYNHDGEAMREVRMVQECDGVPLILIRYNPDGLVTRNTSGSKDGVLMRGTRIDTLASIVADIIHKSQNTEPSEPLTHYKLFYDCGCTDTDGCNFTHVESFRTPQELLNRRIRLSEICW